MSHDDVDNAEDSASCRDCQGRQDFCRHFEDIGTETASDHYYKHSHEPTDGKPKGPFSVLLSLISILFRVGKVRESLKTFKLLTDPLLGSRIWIDIAES